MKLIVSICLSLFIVATADSQWISTYSGSNPGDNSVFNAKGTDIKVDNSGNCYVTGSTMGQGTGLDIVTIKFNSNGDTLWKKTYNGTSNGDDKGFGIAVDNSGNVYVTGTACYTGRSNDVVLLKYNSSGVFQWAKNYSASANLSDDEGLSLAIDANGFIYVAGYATDSNNILNMVTIKYNSSGTMLWSKLEKGPQNLESKGFGIAVDHLGNIDVTGYITTALGSDVLLVQYSPAGIKKWLRTYSNPGRGEDDKAFGIAVDESSNIIVTGYTTILSNSISKNNTDCLTLKYSSNGNLTWIKTYNGGAGKNDRALGIAVDTDGSVYITGYCAGNNNGNDYVTIKYTSAGSQSWVSLYDGTGHGDDKANAIAIIHNSSGNTTGVVVTGQSWGTSGNYDYATVKYSDINGNQGQVSRFAFSPNSNDIATSIAAWNNNIYVTGYSEAFSNTTGGIEQSVMCTMMLNWDESNEMLKKENLPNGFSLYQNYPNPFNPGTIIKFDIPEETNVKIVIYNIQGKQVSVLEEGNLSAGAHEIKFDGSNLSTGIYFYQLHAGGFSDIRKMSLIK